jgi:hypothetical protein
MIEDAIYVNARGVGISGGWASLVTGELVSHGPDLSLFVKSRSDAYKLVDWITPMPERSDSITLPKRIDRAYVDYRTSEPKWLQVKLIVEEEHEAVLERLYQALVARDGYLTPGLVRWAIDPVSLEPQCARIGQWYEKRITELTEMLEKTRNQLSTMATIVTQGNPLAYESDDAAVLLHESGVADALVPEITKLLDKEGRFTPTWPIIPELTV